jgi:hypothetical protein
MYSDKVLSSACYISGTRRVIAIVSHRWVLV